jgi:diguanylate cyclase (GGDEF)-like protein
MLTSLGHPSRPRFLLRIVLPFAAVAVTLNVIAAGFLYWSTAEADRISTDRQRALVDLVISQLRETVAHDQESVTVWDDAVDGVRRRDLGWIDVNLGSWMNSYFGHDGAYILDPHDEPIYASIGGGAVDPTKFYEIWSRAGPLASNLRRRLRDVDEEGISDQVLSIGASDIAVAGGRPAIVSVKPIVSDSGEIEQVAGEEYLHVAVRYLDGTLLQELQDSYLLDGLRFSWDDAVAADEAASPLTGSAGNVMGYYIWRPYRPGSIVFGSVWPILVGLFVTGMAVLSVLLLVLRRRSLSLNRSQAEIRHLAWHDGLTGLPNRVHFEHRLQESVTTAADRDQTMALLYLDLDRFKEVNDTLGHPAGDMLLREFSERLRRAVDPADAVARLGGDEFTIILRNVDSEEAIEQLCSKLVESARHPFHLSNTQIFVGVSIGVAVGRAGEVDAIDLTRQADMALYAAKKNGRSGYAVFTPDMETLLTERRELERDLRKALDLPEQFQIHYQPLFEAKSRKLVGVEALLRWQHPVRGAVGPDVFIPLAEEAGLIDRLGEFVLRGACIAACGWPVETLAVNASAVELANPAYAMRVTNILLATGLSPNRLELEVTETAMSDMDGVSRANVAALRKLGVRFALDDFGTGFSSLGRLQQLDVDRIKIDRSFISGFGSGNGDEAIVRAIVDLAKARGLRTTGEGVETAEQSSFLAEIGCDELQGFLMGRPLSQDALQDVFFPNETNHRTRSHF